MAKSKASDLMATVRFRIAISNHQIRAAIAGRIPSKSTARQYANLVAKIDEQMEIIRHSKDVNSPEFKQAEKTLHKLMTFGRLKLKRDRERLRLRGGFNGKRR